MSFSMRWVFVLMAVVALAVTAVRTASVVWVTLFTSGVLLSLIYAAIRSVVRGREARFCIGFAVAGWIWFSLTAVPMGDAFRNQVFLQAQYYNDLARSMHINSLAHGTNAQGLCFRALEFISLTVVATAGGITSFCLSQKKKASD